MKQNYKHMLAKPDTHHRLRIYIVQHRLKSFDEAINKLLEGEGS